MRVSYINCEKAVDQGEFIAYGKLRYSIWNGTANLSMRALTSERTVTQLIRSVIR
jgi:hypothetical protein